ncbi:hypothetical protein FSP39_016242 [Pinctada imbricata]|uniref:Death domain-containing protein n=1 Tax=Pinctada imbricata TaxID=66713 RepID=A0AA88XWX8_PINIB|nr:hypothetical protein FSP39_016242 [Pinctada imbricata]
MASKQKKASMKKDVSEKSPRPSTGNRAHPPSSKQLLKESAAKIEQLTNENEEMVQKIDSLSRENKDLRKNLDSLATTLLEDAQIKGYGFPRDNISINDLAIEDLLDIVNFLAHRRDKKKNGPVENRIEELETRITHLNMELAKMLKTRLRLESGLEDILESHNLDTAKTKARFMLYEAEGSKLFTFLEAEADEEYCQETTPTNEITDPVTITTTSKGRDICQQTQEIIKEYKTFNLKPVTAEKLPGETHVKCMDEDLKKYLIHELSLYKANGADWRLLGERVGIPAETIQQWKKWRVDYPMEYVFQTWSQSAGASMRMLHRHLVSPQLRCILLAKRVSDFYHVD